MPDFNFHPKCEKMCLTNICFANDLILFARGDDRFVTIMMEAFHKFSDATGLGANLTKCKLYTGGLDDKEKQNLLFIRSVLFAITSYCMQVFPLPKKCFEAH